MEIKHPTPSWKRRRPAGGRPGLPPRAPSAGRRRCRGSVLIIVMWVCVGLVGIALYFANSMTYELRASDNRVSGLAADQAIEGAARYVNYVLFNYATNGAVPTPAEFSCEAVPIGEAKFWLIGRDPARDATTTATAPTEPYFGLVDEASKLDLNADSTSTNMLAYLPNMTADFAQAIVDWRSTNSSGDYTMDYAQLGYEEKEAPFETDDELRLVYGATMDLLVGDDLNRNGVLDANETDATGQLNSGLFEYTTVWTREPNFHSDGTSLTNVNDALTTSTGGGGGGGAAAAATPATAASKPSLSLSSSHFSRRKASAMAKPSPPRFIRLTR